MAVSCGNPTADKTSPSEESVIQQRNGEVTVSVGSPKGPAGNMSPLFGLSIRNPRNTDGQGFALPESDQKERWLTLEKSFIRHPAGSNSFKITSTADTNIRYLLAEVFPNLPESVRHDFTWPPQLPTDQVGEWVTARTGRITIGNEPPNHIPETWRDGNDYVQWAERVYSDNPAYRELFWIQSGKPEVQRYTQDSRLIQKHQNVSSAVSASVLAGRLPARIVTTHKLFPEYPTDWYTFYGELLDDYQVLYGPEVQICFQEWNYKDQDELTADLLPRCAAFLLVMARLRSERGETVSGAAYQQGFAVGTANLIGLNARKGEWTTTVLTDLWDDFGKVFREGRYVSTTLKNRPESLYLEVFEVAGKRYALFANKGSDAVAVSLKGNNIRYYDADMVHKVARFKGSIPAGSAGIIELLTAKRWPSKKVNN